MKKSAVIASIIFAITFTGIAEAKVLPQAGKTAPVKTFTKSTGSTIGVYPKLRADRKALIVTFTNLQNAKSVSYNLVYTQGSGQQEGAGGALNLTGQTTDKAELLFGTCSSGVCRYHSGVKDAKLEVSYTSVNGKRYLKKFKIKI
jgi:hypothetical protein